MHILNTQSALLLCSNPVCCMILTLQAAAGQEEEWPHRSSFHPLLTAPNAQPTFYGCSRWLICVGKAFFFFSGFSVSLWALVTHCCADFAGWRRKSETLIICGWRLHLSHLLLRDVSLKLWPNRWVLRTFSPSSSEAASSERQTGGAVPVTRRNYLQNKSGPSIFNHKIKVPSLYLHPEVEEALRSCTWAKATILQCKSKCFLLSQVNAQEN